MVEIPYPVYQTGFSALDSFSITFGLDNPDAITVQQKEDLLAAIRAAVESVAGGATVYANVRDVAVATY
ncbi:hypothetical protein [Streptomyces sp. NPDC006274]|jgi:hypothetical protein|uniref:hypothetical protein n=1 Tax=unclassified Streptomyces TaxID=2593676 RepID=UPI0033B69469